jgi:hypothetical protein
MSSLYGTPVQEEEIVAVLSGQGSVSPPVVSSGSVSTGTLELKTADGALISHTDGPETITLEAGKITLNAAVVEGTGSVTLSQQPVLFGPNDLVTQQYVSDNKLDIEPYIGNPTFTGSTTFVGPVTVSSTDPQSQLFMDETPITGVKEIEGDAVSVVANTSIELNGPTQVTGDLSVVAVQTGGGGGQTLFPAREPNLPPQPDPVLQPTLYGPDTNGNFYSASSQFSPSWASWKAYNGLTGGNLDWVTGNGAYAGGTGLPNGGSGQWNQVQLATAIVASDVRFTAGSFQDGQPSLVSIYGSNDAGVTLTLLAQHSIVPLGIGNQVTLALPGTASYTTYRFVVDQIYSTSQLKAWVSEIEYIGTNVVVTPSVLNMNENNITNAAAITGDEITLANDTAFSLQVDAQQKLTATVTDTNISNTNSITMTAGQHTLAGGPVSVTDGQLNMNNNRITNLQTNPSGASTDATNRGYVTGLTDPLEEKTQFITVQNNGPDKGTRIENTGGNPNGKASVTVTQDRVQLLGSEVAIPGSSLVECGTNRLQNVGDPLNPQDAATRAWTLTQLPPPALVPIYAEVFSATAYTANVRRNQGRKIKFSNVALVSGISQTPTSQQVIDGNTTINPTITTAGVYRISCDINMQNLSGSPVGLKFELKSDDGNVSYTLTVDDVYAATDTYTNVHFNKLRSLAAGNEIYVEVESGTGSPNQASFSFGIGSSLNLERVA